MVRSHKVAQDHHAERSWRAYEMLRTKAASEGAGKGGLWSKALIAFEGLVATKPTESVRDKARSAAAQVIAEAARRGVAQQQQLEITARMQDTLDRFDANETGFDNLSDEGQAKKQQEVSQEGDAHACARSYGERAVSGCAGVRAAAA